VKIFIETEQDYADGCAPAPPTRKAALPGLIAEANRRLAAVEACKEGDWSAIGERASWLAQHIRRDVQPDWDAYPLGTRRYERLGFLRNR